MTNRTDCLLFVDKISSDSILLQGYGSPLRKDRGVALYIADHMSFVRLSDLESPEAELLWAEIIVDRFGVCDRPPNQTRFIVVLTFFVDLEPCQSFILNFPLLCLLRPVFMPSVVWISL